MKGEFMHARTKRMLEIALMHARAQFEKTCAKRAPAACMVYGGSVWNLGTHLTVIVDRCVCAQHASRVPFADVEVWIYDITGESPKYMGKDSVPANVELLQEPGDRGTSVKKRPFLKS